MPIRTGLDERIDKVRADLSEYFDEAKMAYNEAIKAFTKLDSQVYKEVKQIRQHAREVNWDLTNDLLLILGYPRVSFSRKGVQRADLVISLIFLQGRRIPVL